MSDGRSWLRRARDNAMVLAQKYDREELSVDLVLTIATEAYLQGANDQWTEIEMESFCEEKALLSSTLPNRR